MEGFFIGDNTVYSFRLMTNPDTNSQVWYVIHDKSGASLKYCGGKLPVLNCYNAHYILAGEPFHEWSMLSRGERQRRKKNWLAKQELTLIAETYEVNEVIVEEAQCSSLSVSALAKAVDSLRKASIPVSTNYTYVLPSTPVCANKKENNMHIDDYNDIDVQARQRLTSRTYEAFCAHDRKLENEFHLTDDEAPKTPSEFLQRIKDGKFVLPTDEEFKKHYNYLRDPGALIKWRDPAVKADKDGYDAAHKKLIAARDDVFDAIMVKKPIDALKDVQAFRDATFH